LHDLMYIIFACFFCDEIIAYRWIDMCGCNKNRGGVERALAPPPAPRRFRGRAIAVAPSVEPPVSRPVVQMRNATEQKTQVVRRRHPNHPARIIVVRETITYTVQKPLEIVDTSVWGAHLWRILHVLSLFATTDAAKNAWMRLPAALDGALPCPECAQHYHDWIRANPLTTTGGNAICEWVLALHNQVNARKGIAPWTITQVGATYSGLTVADITASLTAVREKIGVGGLQALEALYAMVPAGTVTVAPVVEVAEPVVVPVEVTETVDVPVEVTETVDVPVEVTETVDVPVDVPAEVTETVDVPAEVTETVEVTETEDVAVEAPSE
jgi:hypothetical protein